MITIKNKKDCCGCSACYSICPKSCIEMKADEEGFLYPNVNKDICINCGLCEKVCPIINKTSEKKTKQEGYLVQIKDEKIRAESTSGGAFTAIAKYVLDRKGVVFGVQYDKDLKIVQTIEYPEIGYAIAVRKGDHLLLDKINSGLQEIMTNGIYQQLTDKHL